MNAIECIILEYSQTTDSSYIEWLKRSLCTIMNLGKSLLSVLSIILILSCSEEKDLPSVTPIETKMFSGPTQGYNPSRNLYFGDLHIHTSWSFDAYVSEVRVSPDEAYRFGKGEAIPHVSGQEVRMRRPLDFMAVSDHAEYMGALVGMGDESSPLYQLELAKQLRSNDSRSVIKAFRSLRTSIALNRPKKELIQRENLQDAWKRMVDIADQHYDPGTFTTFPAYEWTSSPGVLRSLVIGPKYAQNLHRNVIYKGGKVSPVPFSSFDSQNPEKLWEWMEVQRDHNIELLAIPHNANISDGRMYALKTFGGSRLNKDYVETRMRNEPVSEVVQIKGQSMTHPLLSPKDEFADFEIYQYALGQGDPRKEVKPLGGFVREAFKNGLLVEQKLGINPFEFGVIGSSDSHNGGPNVEENNNIGKSGMKDPTPEVRLKNDKAGPRNRKSSVAGLAAVWAHENTREAIYEALEKKEVYATSGPRMSVRFFASTDWKDFHFEHSQWDSLAYEYGKPMGSSLGRETNPPKFMVLAVKDADGANLDRIQMIKGWIDKDGNTQEKIYNIAWSGNRKVDSEGNLPSVGNTVDEADATYTNDIGAVSLHTIWEDPSFDPNLPSFYYVRVLEIPTPRWTTFDAVAIGYDLPREVPSSIQERAWTSPIWYQPERDN